MSVEHVFYFRSKYTLFIFKYSWSLIFTPILIIRLLKEYSYEKIKYILKSDYVISHIIFDF
jgi:hypothetical protein